MQKPPPKSGILRSVKVSFARTAVHVYEDAPKNYLIDYAFLNGGQPGLPTFAQLLGLNAAWRDDFFLSVPDH